MEFISDRLTWYLVRKNTIKEEDFELYRYGFETGLLLVVNIICATCITIALQAYQESIVFFLVFIPLRQFAGGLHLKRALSCSLFSNLILYFFLRIQSSLELSSLTYMSIFIICICMIKILSPVIHVNRNADMIDLVYFKKMLNIILVILVTISILLWFINFNYFRMVSLTTFIVVILLVSGKVYNKLNHTEGIC